VTVHLGARLAGVARDGRAIRAIAIEAGERFAARVFIDAGYEGDLLAGAGVSYTVGRESVSLHGERWAGRQPIRPDKHNFDVPVSAHVGGNDGPLLPLLHDRPLVPEGDGDGVVQSYCFRLGLTDVPENRVPFPRPEGYDPARYEILRRYLASAGPRVTLGLLLGLKGRLPRGKVDVNSIGPLSTNLLDGSNRAYPEVSYARGAVIRDDHLRYTAGLLFFLAHDPGVPPAMRAEINGWGLCADDSPTRAAGRTSSTSARGGDCSGSTTRRSTTFRGGARNTTRWRWGRTTSISARCSGSACRCRASPTWSAKFSTKAICR
jgi:hypothetical protein